MAVSNDLLGELEAKLVNHNALKWQKTETSLRIEAIDYTGFAVTLYKTDDGWGVALGEHGFHDHFDQADDDPLEFVAWCYSGSSRLREIRYGSVVGRTILEIAIDEEWHKVSTTGLIFFPFWRKPTQRILQNPTLIRPI